MNTSPRISVIIPAYNVASYIVDTLASVFAQTFTDYEVIVVNDGSPDTAEFERAIEPYRTRIHYLKQENGGASVARNSGLRAARGEFAAFLDADDLWLPNYLDRQLRYMDEQGCDLVGADAEIFGDSNYVFGDSTYSGRTFMGSLSQSPQPDGQITFLDLLSARRNLVTSGVLVRRELVLAVGLFDEALRNAQDFDLWLRIARHKARLALRHEVLVRYRCRPGSLTGDALNTGIRELRVFDKVERSYEFTPEERAQAMAVIGERRARIEFELGKVYLLKGEFESARAAFSKAAASGCGWKPRVALWAICAAPNVARTLYSRRVNRTT